MLACVDSVATAIFAAPETRTTAAIVKAAGLVDAFQTPRAALTLFAPTDTAWVPHRASDGLLAQGALRRRRRHQRPLADVVFAHVVRGVAPLASFRDGHLAHTLFAGLALRVRTGARKAPGDDVKVSRARSKRSSRRRKTHPVRRSSGVETIARRRPFRAVSLEPKLVVIYDRYAWGPSLSRTTSTRAPRSSRLQASEIEGDNPKFVWRRTTRRKTIRHRTVRHLPARIPVRSRRHWTRLRPLEACTNRGPKPRARLAPTRPSSSSIRRENRKRFFRALSWTLPLAPAAFLAPAPRRRFRRHRDRRMNSQSRRSPRRRRRRRAFAARFLPR